MAGSRAIVISVLAHGAALGAFASRFHGDPPPALRTNDAPLVVEVLAPAMPPPTAPIEVEFLEAPRESTAPMIAATTTPATDASEPNRASSDPSLATGAPREPRAPNIAMTAPPATDASEPNRTRRDPNLATSAPTATSAPNISMTTTPATDAREPNRALPDPNVATSAPTAPNISTTARPATGGVEPAGERPDPDLVAAASGAAREPDGAPSEPNGAPTGPSALGPLAMRGRRHDLSLSTEAAERSLGPARPLEPRVKPTGKIAPAGREGIIDDAVAKFRVHGDGTVSIADKRDFTWEWRVPLPTPRRILEGAKELGDDLAAWRDDPYRDTRAGKWQDLPRHLQATPGGCMTFGDEMCDAVTPETGKRRPPKVQRSLSGDGVIVPILGGKADITAYLHRKFIGDPFASRKLKLLDDTRAERVESGRVFRAKQLAASAEIMANNLTTLWAATSDPAVRREALFELWDECSEGEGESGAAGDRARAMVIGWIGAHLPRGGSDAYGADEIARLDARRSSRQHFAPYVLAP